MSTGPAAYEKWSLLHQIDQLDTNYFGLINDHRHIEAGRSAEGKNLIEQTVAYNATVACTFLDLLEGRAKPRPSRSPRLCHVVQSPPIPGPSPRHPSPQSGANPVSGVDDFRPLSALEMRRHLDLSFRYPPNRPKTACNANLPFFWLIYT